MHVFAKIDSTIHYFASYQNTLNKHDHIMYVSSIKIDFFLRGNTNKAQ
jgi:hypothetical protein